MERLNVIDPVAASLANTATLASTQRTVGIVIIVILAIAAVIFLAASVRSSRPVRTRAKRSRTSPAARSGVLMCLQVMEGNIPRALRFVILRAAAHLCGMHQPDTIVALSTAPGTGAIAVLRLSGPSTQQVMHGVAPGMLLTPQ